MTDHELLNQYTRHGSREALNELAARHVDWVYSAARRQVRGDAHLAEDVTQAVFLVLAKKAAGIGRSVVVGGWLFRACRYAAADARRQAARRARIESRAAQMRPETTTDVPDDREHWAQLTPVLDESLARLGRADRDAVILRYYQGKTHGEVAAALGVSEEAAKKRVARAVEKLGAILRSKGATLAPAALPVLLATNLTTPAPTGLLAMTASPTAAALAKTAAAAMTWAKLQLIAAIAAMFVIAVPVGMLVTHAMAKDRVAVAAGDSPSGRAPAAPANASGPTIEVLRWHALLDPALHTKFQTLGWDEPTRSVGFEVRRMSGDDARKLVTEGTTRKQVVATPSEVKWLDPAYPFDNLSQIVTLPEHNTIVTVSGEYKLAPATGGVKVTAKYPTPFFLVNSDNNAAIDFDGRLAGGEAVVFMGAEAKVAGAQVRPMLVLQAESCPPAAAPFLRALTSSADFLGAGVDRMVEQAQAGVDLNRAAENLAPPANWTHTFSDGSTARLVAVGEPTKRPFVWWDGNGGPVAVDPFYYTACIGNGVKEYGAVVEFRPAVAPKPAQQTVSSSRSFVAVDVSTGKARLVCGKGVGEWDVLGKVSEELPLDAGAQHFTIQKIGDMFPNSPHPQTQVEVKHTAGPDVDVKLEVTDAKGKRIAPQNGDWSPHVRAGNEIMDVAYAIFPIAAKDVRTVIVSTRKREWGTIEGFKLEPARDVTTTTTTTQP